MSLLKAYWGDAATADNDFCFDYLPRLTGDHSTYTTVKAQIEGRCKGYFLVGENPAVGSANGKMQRLGMANLDWLVVRDLQMIESATFWKDGPEIETGELVTEEIGTEIFFLPAATHVEKAGSFTQTQRMLQWRDKAVDPPGDAAASWTSTTSSGSRIREKLAGSTDEMDRPLLDLAWDYPVDEHGERRRRGGAARDQRHRARRRGAVGVHRAEARRLDRVRLLDLLRRVRRRGQPGAAPQAALGAGPGRRRVGLGVAGQPAHPLQPRVRGTRRHARGASARSTSGGTPSRAGGSARDVPDFIAGPGARPRARARARRVPTRSAARTRSSCRPTARPGCSPRSGVADGPMPTHYEPPESPVHNPLYPQQNNPARRSLDAPANPINPSFSEVFPYVFTTYRLTEHHTAGAMSRTLPYLTELQPEPFCEVSPRLARERGLEHGGWATIVTARTAIEARVLVTDRLRSLRLGDRVRRAGRAALPLGPQRHHAPATPPNDLVNVTMDPNVYIQDKVGTCDIQPGPAAARAATSRRTSRSTVAAPGSTCDAPDGRRHRLMSSSLWGRLDDVAGRRRLRPTTRRGWGSSPTPRCASAARPARWPARSGTRSPTTATC